MNLEEQISEYFRIYGSEPIEGGYRFYVIPTRSPEETKKFLAVLSQRYNVALKYHYGEIVLEIREHEKTKDRIWINIVLLVATIFTTTLVGSTFYGPKIDIIGGLKFSAAIMFVLGSHEMGHYFAAKRWKMKTSLPYFIPFPTIIGTLGAIIKHKGAIPNRKALFDVGVSGPLAGVVASIIVILIGLMLPFKVPGKPTLYIGTPPLFDALMILTRHTSQAVHPVAFAGWVGLFITFLNMVPVGQLDGGHVLRSMVGKKAEVVSRIIPIILVGYGLYLTEFEHVPGSIWIFWGLITLFFSLYGHPDPLDDETPLDTKRFVLGIVSFIIAVLCFTPVPFYF